jgi:hypothetical protein
MDPITVQVHFSKEVRRAFSALAAAVHLSDHFDADMLSVLQDWAAGKKQSVFDVMVAFPAIAKQTFKHIHATGDKRAEQAWGEIGSELLERGFSLARDRGRSK